MYYKIIENGFIIAVTTGAGQVPVTEAEYNELLAVFRSKPSAPAGYEYMLDAVTLEWELMELPPEPEMGDEIDDGEAMNILMGGE